MTPWLLLRSAAIAVATLLERRAQANIPAAWFLLCPVIDYGRHQDRTSPSCNCAMGAGGGVCDGPLPCWSVLPLLHWCCCSGWLRVRYKQCKLYACAQVVGFTNCITQERQCRSQNLCKHRARYRLNTAYRRNGKRSS